MKSKEEIELELRKPKGNFPGYSAPLEFRALRKTDGLLLAPVFRTSAKSIRTYLGEYQNAEHWWLKDSQAFVTACVNDDFPSLHYLFTIGGKPVALGSFHSFGDFIDDVQIVLAVFGTNQGKGIGKAVAQTLKMIAFEVWGFSNIWWVVDATNRASIKIADSIGCQWDSTFETTDKYGDSGSGLWQRFVVTRNAGLAPGILQGAPVDYWNMPKSPGLLQAYIDSQNRSSQIQKSVRAKT